LDLIKKYGGFVLINVLMAVYMNGKQQLKLDVEMDVAAFIVQPQLKKYANI
jgi:hypothetical protein